jgi:hypothetical protein
MYTLLIPLKIDSKTGGTHKSQKSAMRGPRSVMLPDESPPAYSAQTHFPEICLGLMFTCWCGYRQPGVRRATIKTVIRHRSQYSPVCGNTCRLKVLQNAASIGHTPITQKNHTAIVTLQGDDGNALRGRDLRHLMVLGRIASIQVTFKVAAGRLLVHQRLRSTFEEIAAKTPTVPRNYQSRIWDLVLGLLSGVLLF